VPGLSYPWAVNYEVVAAAYQDLERLTSRLALIDRLAELLRQTPEQLLPQVVYLCQGQIAPAFTGIEIGLADKMVTRALADGTGAPLDEVRVTLRETGDLGLTVEQLLAAHGAADRPSTLEVGVVFETLHQVAAAAGPGSQGGKLELLGGLLERATPLEGRYLARTVTGSLRLGVGSPTILDALAQVHTGSRASRPVLERAYNICSDLGLVAATLVHGGLAEVEAMRVRAGNPVRPMLAQRMSDAAELLARLGGSCGAEYKYDGVRLQAHRTADGRIELFTRRLERVAGQFPDVVELLDGGSGRGTRSWRARWSRPTRCRASCARSRRSCTAAASTASPRRSTSGPSACTASTCGTPTART
jgi:DNA ligase-1